MIKRFAWISMALLLVPSMTWAGGGDEHAPHPRADSGVSDDGYIRKPHDHGGVYYSPQSPHLPNRHMAPDERLNRVVGVLRTTNKAQVNSYVPRVYSLRNVNPYSVIRFVRRVVQAEEGAIFTFVSPEGNGGRMLVAVPEYQLASLDELMRTIDKPNLTSKAGTRRIYAQLKHRRSNVSVIPVLDDSAFLSTFGTYLTGNGSFILSDPEQNAVFIQDAPSGANYLFSALVDRLDQPTPQAVFNTKIYELDMNNSHRIGLDYVAWKNGPGAKLGAFGAFAERGRVSLRNGSAGLLADDAGIGQLALPKSDFEASGYNFAYRYDVDSSFFDYLAVRGKARILNSARIAVLNTRVATITAGDQILFYRVLTNDPTGVRTQFTTPGELRGDPFSANVGRALTNNPLNQLNVSNQNNDLELANPDGFIQAGLSVTESLLVPVDTGISLALSPLIYENGLDVDIDGTVKDYNGFDDRGIPRLRTEQFSTSIRMSKGEQAVLGGLLRETVAKTNPRAPILGSLPLVGHLFGNENVNRRKTEVVVALNLDDIVRYNGDDYGIIESDESLIKQGEGSEDISTPDTTFGFDMSVLDHSKESYTRIFHERQ